MGTSYVRKQRTVRLPVATDLQVNKFSSGVTTQEGSYIYNGIILKYPQSDKYYITQRPSFSTVIDPAEEAVEHIGETVIITGPVIDYLDFTFPDLRTDPVLGVGNPFGPNAFLVRLMVDVDSLPEDLYVGITISIIGEIGPNSFGGARIWVDDLSQIEIIE